MSDRADEKAKALARTAPDACEGDPCGQCQALATSIAAELRAAYERGVREAATIARVAWENGDSADVARVRILALLGKESGGDG